MTERRPLAFLSSLESVAFRGLANGCSVRNSVNFAVMLQILSRSQNFLLSIHI